MNLLGHQNANQKFEGFLPYSLPKIEIRLKYFLDKKFPKEVIVICTKSTFLFLELYTFL